MPLSSGRAARIARFSTDCVVVGVLLHIVLLTGWLSNGVQTVVNQRSSDAMMMHAVLRAGVTEDQAAGLASRLTNSIAGTTIRVIGPAEARGLLALQEPWMKSLPNVEIGRLPVLAEIGCRSSGNDPALLRALRDQISREPEVEFVVFNDNGLEELVAFSRNVHWYASAMHRWLWAVSCIALLLYAMRTSRHAPAMLAQAIRQLMAFLIGLSGAWLALRVIDSTSAVQFRLPSHSIIAGWRELLFMSLLWLLAGVISSALRARPASEARR
ncbi:MAG: hypothetical protein ACR2IE_08440 [Candidatus Sumerlaeaceae bacterium]